MLVLSPSHCSLTLALALGLGLALELAVTPAVLTFILSIDPFANSVMMPAVLLIIPLLLLALRGSAEAKQPPNVLEADH